MGLAKNGEEVLGSEKGGKLVENLKGFNFPPTVLFHESVRQR